MKKTILQAFILLSLAAGIYLLISRVNWMKLFRIEKMTDALEQKLGDMVWAGMEEQSIEEGKEYDRVDSLVTAICKSNGFKRDKIKLHIMGDSEVNAFALPDRHMVVHTGLVNAVHNNDELSGVLAHEIAHMELSHVMKKLLKQMGYTLLISITTGEAGGGAIKELLENSLDAGATKITLLVKDGGSTLMQVIDNGKGMSETDVRLCWERHATSKIQKAEDLFRLNTYGFRGEAMASIAAVAQVEMDCDQMPDQECYRAPFQLEFDEHVAQRAKGKE